MEKSKDATEIVEWALWASHLKPYAVANVPAVQDDLKLQSTAAVKKLKAQQTLGVLRRLVNMGFEENPACPLEMLQSFGIVSFAYLVSTTLLLLLMLVLVLPRRLAMITLLTMMLATMTLRSK